MSIENPLEQPTNEQKKAIEIPKDLSDSELYDFIESLDEEKRLDFDIGQLETEVSIAKDAAKEISNMSPEEIETNQMIDEEEDTIEEVVEKDVDKTDKKNKRLKRAVWGTLGFLTLNAIPLAMPDQADAWELRGGKPTHSSYRHHRYHRYHRRHGHIDGIVAIGAAAHVLGGVIREVGAYKRAKIEAESRAMGQAMEQEQDKSVTYRSGNKEASINVDVREPAEQTESREDKMAKRAKLLAELEALRLELEPEETGKK